ncbi:hypothetical protein GOP47_0017297 [Adiantum capillus-veneris]|uniref:Uncharacterized protein n=1 Tax=Adiantum capillus-veneris TaxID=13818 RepID=A0A9D4UF29_ADICA|nr:hypothetical protein GOP47_0017297 [Adiantum capillus-veneris]
MESAAPQHLPVTLGPVETILPSSPTDLSPLYLSQIDQCVAYIVDTVYFYPAPPGSGPADRSNVVPKLRQCLADILVPYHFMAGRLCLNSQGRLHIDCNREGVLFTAASSELTMAELGNVTHPNPAFRSLVLQAINALKMTDNPLLMMQVTTFKCGGFSIGFSMNHAVFDGQGAAEFVLNFSSLTRGAGMLVEPNPDRTMLKPREPPQVKFKHPEYLKLLDIPKGTAFTTSELADLDFAAIQLSQKHIYKMFPFSGDMLNRLKDAAMSEASLEKCSSFDAIAAHVWQARTKAIGMPASDPAKVLFAVDIRSRIEPPLPKGFVGNAILSGYASVPAAELQKGSLSYAVGKIQEATKTITDEYIRSSIDWGAEHGGVPNLPGGIFLSAWWKLPFHLVDFGWGKPSYAGPVVNAMVEFVLLLSNGTQEGLNIYIALEPSHMQEFEKLIYDF